MTQDAASRAAENIEHLVIEWELSPDDCAAIIRAEYAELLEAYKLLEPWLLPVTDSLEGREKLEYQNAVIGFCKAAKAVEGV